MRNYRFRKLCSLLLVLLALAPAGAQPKPEHASSLVWHSWSDDIFAQAKREHKFVLLDLEAVWCHWCHVMDTVTYEDPDVRSILDAKYLAVKVDQDSRPDLSNRYEDYGWPATVVFNADGQEIVKRQGYMPPKPMLAMLKAIVDDPTPGPSVVPEVVITPAATSQFPTELLASLRKNYEAQYDTGNAGWGFSHKYLDGDSIEYAMFVAAHGDKQAEQRARDTLRAEQKLIDPVWGGAYQYSAGGNWDEPHFEKLIGIQAQTLRIYSLAYAQWHDPDYLRAAQSIRSYVRAFLADPDGAFYVSQDADLVPGEHSAEYFQLNDQARRRQGVPRVDNHIYARENGWMISALCGFYAATGDATALAEARRAAEWIMANRALPHGGFAHGSHDAAGPYLGDTLSMGQAFLDLYAVTGDRRWLQQAEDALGYINWNFTSEQERGWLTSKTPTDHSYHPRPERDENIQLARFANLTYQYTGHATEREIAEKAMLYLAAKEIALRPMSGGVLLAETEFSSSPLHLTVVGPKGDTGAAQLFQTALQSPLSYKRVEWWDPGTGAPVRDDVRYPRLQHAAAFLCGANSCSKPIYSAEILTSQITRALHPSIQ